jgi:HSP20 family protein
MHGLVTRRSFSPGSRSMFRGLEGLHRDMDALFDGVFGSRDVAPVTDWTPRVDTFTKDDKLVLRADLPGVDPKEVDISLEGNILTVRGERKTQQEDANYREVSYGRFERRIRVPNGTDAEKIAATYTNGVLEVTVPLPKPVARKVPVEVTNGAPA